jgi:hypothetical protein
VISFTVLRSVVSVEREEARYNCGKAEIIGG